MMGFDFGNIVAIVYHPENRGLGNSSLA